MSRRGAGLRSWCQNLEAGSHHFPGRSGSRCHLSGLQPFGPRAAGCGQDGRDRLYLEAERRADATEAQREPTAGADGQSACRLTCGTMQGWLFKKIFVSKSTMTVAVWEERVSKSQCEESQSAPSSQIGRLDCWIKAVFCNRTKCQSGTV